MRGQSFILSQRKDFILLFAIGFTILSYEYTFAARSSSWGSSSSSRSSSSSSFQSSPSPSRTSSSWGSSSQSSRSSPSSSSSSWSSPSSSRISSSSPSSRSSPSSLSSPSSSRISGSSPSSSSIRNSVSSWSSPSPSSSFSSPSSSRTPSGSSSSPSSFSSSSSRWGSSSSSGSAQVSAPAPAAGTSLSGKGPVSGGSPSVSGTIRGTKYSVGSPLGSNGASGTGGTRLGGTSTAELIGTRTGLGSRWGLASGTGSQWGSSGSSGKASPIDSVRNRFAGGSSGVARSNYGTGGSRNVVNRPKIQTPIATASPSAVIYSPTYNTYHSSYSNLGGYGSSRSSLGSFVGGYALGSMMGSLSRPWGYYGYGGYGYYGYPYGGCLYGCSPLVTYVPYRERYIEYYVTPAPETSVVDYNVNVNNNVIGNVINGNGDQGLVATTMIAPAQKPIDTCMLARWNRELPFAELPNMALEFLANNTISGNTTSDKAKFMFEFLTASLDAYDHYNSSADIFTIPTTFDVNHCDLTVYQNSLIKNTAPEVDEEPILTSLRHVLSLYSNRSNAPGDLQDVVDAARTCLPQGPKIANPEILPCLDFTTSPDQLAKPGVSHSMFGNAELCRRQLSPDMLKCLPKDQGGSCRLEHLKVLNLFARNFYLCNDGSADDKIPQSAFTSDINNNVIDTTTPVITASTQPITTTTQKPGFWSRVKSWFG